MTISAVLPALLTLPSYRVAGVNVVPTNDAIALMIPLPSSRDQSIKGGDGVAGVKVQFRYSLYDVSSLQILTPNGRGTSQVIPEMFALLEDYLCLD